MLVQFKEIYDEEIIISGPCNEEIKAKTMELILDYLYTSEIDFSQENVYDILLASDYLQIEGTDNQIKNLIIPIQFIKIF